MIMNNEHKNGDVGQRGTQGVDGQNVDPELTDLLGQLDEIDNAPKETVESESTVEPSGLEPHVLKPKDKQIALSEPQNTPDEVIPHNVDVVQYFERYDAMAEEIFAACRNDRREAQEVIALCKEQIGEAIDNDRSPARMYVDSLVKAVEVKANVNDTTVKMIDAGAKLLAAAKNQINIQQNNVSIGDDLDDILNRPMNDEY